MKNEEKTNVMRLLESKKIPYAAHSYDPDPSLSGEDIARILDEDPDHVFKTLVTRGDDNLLFVFVIPSGATLDLKKAAQVSGNKKIEMIHVKEIFDLTGYIRGGCSPIGMKKQYPTYIDETAILFDSIYFSAGKRGVQIILSPETLAEFIGAEFADLTKE